MEILLIHLGLQLFKGLLILATLPLLSELLLLSAASCLPAGKRTTQPSSEPLRLTIVVPCHNEEVYITRCLQSIVASGGPDVDVMLIAHNCTDETVVCASVFPNVRIFSLDDDSRRGKGFALAHAFSLAFVEGESDAVLIIDADSVVTPNLIPVIHSELHQTAVLQCRYEVYNSQATWRTRILTLALQGMNVVRPMGRDRLALSCGILGNGFAVRRDAMSHVAYSAYSLVEDVEFHLSLIEQGHRVHFIDSAAVKGEMPSSSRGVLTQRTRWEGGRLAMLSHYLPSLLFRAFSGNVSSVEPLLDLASMPIAFAVCLLGLLSCLPGRFCHIYAVTAITVVCFHLYVAARVGPDFYGDLRAVLLSPLYVVWKVLVFGRIVKASRASTEWVRTTRSGPLL